VTRVCVIGNSHAACFKIAWNTLKASYPSVTLTFFADRKTGISELEPKGGLLVPTSERLQRVLAHTSVGHTAIDPRDYDIILMVGLSPGYPDAPGFYSYAAASRALLDETPASIAFELIRKIRQTSAIPIFLAHKPLLRHEGETQPDGDAGPYRRLIKLLNDELVRDAGATLLEQPEQTITHCFFSRPEYAIGSSRLDVGSKWLPLEQPGDQRAHMNELYGEIYLSTHLPTIMS